jgi:hypothetical protein
MRGQFAKVHGGILGALLASAACSGGGGGRDPFVLDRDQCAGNWQIAFTAPALDSSAPSRDFLRVGGGRIFLGNYDSGGKPAIASSKEATDEAIGFGEGLRETFGQLDELLVTLRAAR